MSPARSAPLPACGARFWYENPGWPSSLSPGQLQTVRSFSLARLLCDNTDEVETVQVRAMVLPDEEVNPRLPCTSRGIPSLDLHHWRDRAGPGARRQPRNGM